MSVDEILLMAYVDGNVSAERRAEVEAAVSHSAELTASLAAMRASVLPYASAFDRQELPPVPTALAQRIAELSRVSGNSRLTPNRQSTWLRLAAAFFAGVVLCGAAFELWPGSASVSLPSSISPWIKAVADYQQLYSRETLADVVEDRTLSAKTIDDLRRVEGMRVRVPDLHDYGLTFKRVQRLSFQNQAVVQIVYLPERGDPLALCITQDARRDEAPHPQQLGEMGTVAWRRGRLGYVLLGKGAPKDLTALAQLIANGDAATLYGRLLGTETRDPDVRSDISAI